MQASSPDARDEDVDLLGVWSDLHALRKLYCLLQKCNEKAQQGQGEDTLDEKSRVLLKKLLDGATQQALGCPAKFVSSRQGPPPSKKSQKELRLDPPLQNTSKPSEDFRNYHSTVDKVKNESDVPLAQAMLSQHRREENELVAEEKLLLKPCPVCGRDDLKDESLRKSMRISDDKLHMTTRPGLPIPHRRIHHGHCDQAALDRRLKTGSKRELEPQEQKPRRIASGTRSLLEAADVASGHKRIRFEPSDRRSRTSSRSRTEERVCYESTQMKAKKNSDQPSCSGGPKSNDSRPSPTAQPVATSGAALPRRMGSLKDAAPKKECSVKSGGVSSGSGLTRPHRPPSHGRSLTQKERVLPRGQLTRVEAVSRSRVSEVNRSGSARLTGPDQRIHLSRIPSGMEGQECSSSCKTRSSSISSLRTSSIRSDTEPGGSSMIRRRSKVSPWMLDRRPLGPARKMKTEMVPRRTPRRHSLVLVPAGAARSPPRRVTLTGEARKRPPPRRMPSHHRKLVMPSRTAKDDRQMKPERKEGRLTRFKNKLAIIFHHHHHHHLHHDGHVDGGRSSGTHTEHHHLSPWEYVRKILPRSSRDRAAERATAKHGGYLHVLLDALLRHVWGTRQRRAAQAERRRRRRLGKAGSRMGATKLHWWQRFRKRGGVRLATRKKPRLRLGFNRTRSRANKKT